VPNCFQLRKKGAEAPEVLQKVDEAICAHYGVEVSSKYWFHNWYNVIGFLIALKGHNLGTDELREEVNKWYDDWPSNEAEEARECKGQMFGILNFLEEHYESTNFVEIGRR
jgi:hypothetical protein